MGINPGKQTVYYMCKTWLQKVHSGWDMGDLEIKIYKINSFSLFYFVSKIQCMECNALNGTHVKDVEDIKNTCISVVLAFNTGMSERSKMYCTVLLFEIAFYTGLWMFK